MRYPWHVLVAFCLAASSISEALAQSPPTAAGSASAAATDAVVHALSVEQRASRTSFAELDAFGQAAFQRADAEGLSRLQHVARIIINQGDFAAAERWNEQLRQSAQRQQSARYLAVAQINALQIRHLRDHDVNVADMESMVAAQTDWLPKVFAQTAMARRLFDEGRVGASMRLMAHTIALIPQEQAQEASVAAAAWDLVSIAHVMVDDVPGYLRAIAKAESYMRASDYPRPDFESIYNLTQSLSYLGRHEEAQTLVQIYARLAKRTGTPTLRGYAGNICAFAASSREDWAGVLQCVAPFGENIDAPDIARNSMLPFRATAYARTGQVALARRDVEELRSRIAQRKMRMMSGFQRAEAELLIAQGDYVRGIPALRAYHLARFQKTARSAAAAMEQIVVNMEDQLQAESEQSRLKSEIIANHQLLAAVLLLLGAILSGLVFLLAKQRKAFRLQAITDTLTGLPNRRYTEKRANEIIAHAVTRNGRAVVTLLDLDHFKSCNDSFGHDAGDDALKTFAKLVNGIIRPGDVFGRWGGEEFLLVLPDLGLPEAHTLLQRIADKAAATTVTLAPEYPLRFSGGAVDVPGSAKSLEEVLLASDQLLYAAKAAGRNRVHFSGSQPQ